MDDYCKEFEYIDPLQSYKPWVKERYNKDMIMPANERQIAAVFVCSDPVDWGRDLQVWNLFIQLHHSDLQFLLFSYFLWNET